MPRGDKTGPYGNGPKTGRGLGFCVRNDTAGFQAMERGMGRGAGYGRGNGRGNGYHHRGMGFGVSGYHHGFHGDVSEKTLIENEINILKDQLTALEERLKNIKE